MEPNTYMKSIAGGLRNEEPNPLLQYPIFKIVMEYQSFQDLQRCREVCSQWKSFIDPHIKAKGKVVISGNLQLGAFLRVVRSGKVADTYPTTLILQSACLFSTELGFYADTITSLELYDSACDMECVLENFPRLKSLLLHCSRLFSCKSFDELSQPEPTVNEGHLRSLHCASDLHHLHVRGDYLPNRTLFQALLLLNPNLETLTYERVRSSGSDAFGKWLLNEVLARNFLKLKYLNVGVMCDHYHLEKLMQSTSLEELSINVGTDMLPSFKTLLSQLGCLKQLELGVVGQSLPGDIVEEFCRLCPSLERVSVHCPCYPRFTRVARPRA